MKRLSRYTLIELLIVVVIIAILASLLLPSLSQARRQAQKLQCINILKQYAMGVHLYALDFDDCFPTSEHHQESLRNDLRSFWPLLKDYLPQSNPLYPDEFQGPINEPRDRAIPQNWLCPSALNSYNAALTRARQVNLYELRPTRNGSYSTALVNYDSHPAASQMAGKQRLTALPEHARYFFMEDSGFNDGTDDRSTPFLSLRDFIDGQYPWGHGKSYNVAFLDGHVQNYQRKRRMTHWMYVYTRILDFSDVLTAK